MARLTPAGDTSGAYWLRRRFASFRHRYKLGQMPILKRNNHIHHLNIVGYAGRDFVSFQHGIVQFALDAAKQLAVFLVPVFALGHELLQYLRSD